MTQDDITQRKSKRFQFLHRLYEMSHGLKPIRVLVLRKELGLAIEEVEDAVKYLMGERLIRFWELDDLRSYSPWTVRGEVCLTHHGVVEVEAALSEPEKPTQHFPPLNIISFSRCPTPEFNKATQQCLKEM